MRDGHIRRRVPGRAARSRTVSLAVRPFRTERRGPGDVAVTDALQAAVPVWWTVTVIEDRSGVLLLRVWQEGRTGVFRARMITPGVRRGPDTDDDFTVALASSPENVTDAVRAWLAEFLAAAGVER
jgi:hypothetical protein